MRAIIKKVPIPICGVMLGTFALGNLLQSYSEGIRYACGIVGGILFLVILLKLILFPQMIKEDMKNPIMASVAGTFSMSLMLLSTYVKPWIGQAAFYLWILAIALHIALIIYFTVKFILKLEIKKVFASYYIVYVGIAVAAITAPAYEQTGIGTAAFWFGFVTLIILLILTTVRYIKHMEVPEPAKPLLCIYAAPTSLCVAGYVQSVASKSFSFLIAMYILASVLYIFALIKAVGYLRLPFYPSYASFTFPFVISAIASKQTMACAANMGSPIPVLSYVVIIETIIAVVFVLYVLVRYIGFLAGSNK
ncbi:MAG: TDT family transporter [Lachnospiraceae bacterium]